MILARIFSILILALAGLFLSPSTAIAVEIDDTSAYYVPLKDANEVLNKRINAVLGNAVADTKSCSIEELRKNTKSALRPKGLIAKIFGGGFEEYVIVSKDIEKYTPEIDSSLYANTPYSRSHIVTGGKIFRIATIYPSIRINGNIMGVDKLSHFFETGLELYNDHLLPELVLKAGRDAQIQDLVNRAIELEETNLGWTMTGIKSYGDIQSHLQGAFFWAGYFKTDGAWLECNDNRFVMKKKFDIGQFSQVGWSEAAQCNEYAPNPEDTYLQKFFNAEGKSFQQEVDINVEALEKKHSRRYTCPIDVTACKVSDQFLRNHIPYLTADQYSRVTSPSCRLK